MLETKSPAQRAQRHAVNLFVGYGIDAPPFGRTRDLSTSGIFVETEDRPALKSIIDVHMVWGDDAVSSEAKVVRHADDGVGLTFVAPGEWFVQVITEVIESSPALAIHVRDGNAR